MIPERSGHRRAPPWWPAVLLALSACGESTAPPVAEVDFASVSAGGFHTCGLSTEGRAYCWGSNRQAQLGAGPATALWSHFYPLAVSDDIPYVAVSVGGQHSCAIDAAGRAYCWGWNRRGQLGTGSSRGPETCGPYTCASSPTAVSGDLQFRSIVAGWEHTCALSRAGDVYCWGANSNGELGIGRDSTNAPSPVPMRVQGDLKVVALSAGERHTCALSEDGAAYCWGENRWAQLGPSADDTCPWEDGTPVPCSATPVPAAEGLAFVTIAAGAWHSCALATDGATYCWGYGGTGRLGVESDSVRTECPYQPASLRCSPQPVRVLGGLAFVSLTAGGSHTCGLTTEGQAYCWGAHLIGQLGDCSLREFSWMPRPVCGGHRFTQLHAGSHHSCAVSVDGAAYCWGGNDVGELGSTSLTAFGPVKVDRAVLFDH